MAKKKPAGGKHTTPRRAVQIPEDWFLVAQHLASAKAQPTAWFLVDLIRQAGEGAEMAGMPALPWAVPERGEKK